MEIQRLWRCQDHGMSSEENCGHEVEKPKGGYICYRQQIWRGRAAQTLCRPDDSIRSLRCCTWNSRTWCLSLWILVLLWFGFPHHSCLQPSFGAGMFTLQHYMLKVCALVFISQGLVVEGLLASEKRLCTYIFELDWDF